MQQELALDPTQPTRPGEELALAELAPYLRRHLPAAEGDLRVEQFPSGHSNLTYLLRLGKQELVLRRPPFGNRVKSAHDMGREFRVLDKLHRVYPPAPKPYLYCEDEAILGAPFYVMERRRGVVLRQRLPAGLEFGPELACRLSEAVVDRLADLHRVDYTAAGLADLGKPDGYVERQVGGWASRYERARTHDWPQLDQAGRWLATHMPAESGAAVIHNDFKYDNLLLDPRDLTQVVAVLDWEMATLGDPLMDLGTFLAYWVEAGDDPRWRALGFGPTAVAGSLSRRQLAARYAERTAVELPALTFYFVFGLYKLAVILQQIYYRWAKGHTRDPRFEHFDSMVELLGQVAARSIDQDMV